MTNEDTLREFELTTRRVELRLKNLEVSDLILLSVQSGRS